MVRTVTGTPKVMVVKIGSTLANGAWVSPVANALMPTASMFWAATSVSIAGAAAGAAAFSASMNEKMLVTAGVVRCAPVSAAQIGAKPSATLSLLSAALSYRSQSNEKTEDSLHQQ